MLSHGHTNFGQSLGKIPKDKQKQAFNYTESKTGMLSKLRVEHNKNDEKKKTVTALRCLMNSKMLSTVNTQNEI